MNRLKLIVCVLLIGGTVALDGIGAKTPQRTARANEQSAPRYGIAFASFAPLNTDLFVAEADGRNPRPLLPHPDLDYNGSFASDGHWILFTSTRNGSADIYRVRPDGSGLEQLTKDPAFDDQGALSPDGRSLAFVSSRSGQADIWILELDSGRLRNLTQDPGGDFRPSWSPDGQWLAFSSDRDSKKPRRTFVMRHSTEIYRVRPDGSSLQRITRLDAFAGSPAWSPDGTRLLYYEAPLDQVGRITTTRLSTQSRGTTQIVSIDLVTGERQSLTSGPGEKRSPRWTGGRIAYVTGEPDGGVEFLPGAAGARGEMNSPSWSSDGRQMVFHRDVDSNWPPLRSWPSADSTFRLVRTGIFPSYSPGSDRLVSNDRYGGSDNSVLLLNADGSRREVLFKDAAGRSALAPVWSPRGDRVAFGLGTFFQGTNGPATADIAVMRVDGSDLRIVTDGSGNFGFPSWSPDGRRLVYRVAGSDRSGLSIVDIETRAMSVLTTSSAHDNSPSWSPRGDRIVFTSNRDGDFEIYTIKVDGTDLRRLTRSPGNDAHTAWSPDGEWIAFASERGGFKDEAPLTPYNQQPYGDLYVMRADGSEVRRLTDDQFEDGTPSWVPLPRLR